MEREVERLAAFVSSKQFSDLSQDAVDAIKIRVLDSLGCAIGALKSPLIAMLKAHTLDFGGNSLSTMIGNGKTSPDRAAFFNGALIRYLDFNDSFLAKNETCHPSDSIGAILAACEYSKGSGKDFLTAIAIAYQVQCRLSEEAPVRKKGFDHTTQGAYAVASGVASALHLSKAKTANAIAMAAVANNALRVTRTGKLSHWKGLAFPNTSFSATHAAFLAMHGVTGPLEIFEGNKGFKEAISGPFEIDWGKEGLDRVQKTIIKKYNAEIHSQATLEGIIELCNRHSIRHEDVVKIEVDTFDVAFHIIGGGEEGEKKEIQTKEEADHSLPYMVAVALIDGKVLPEQYEPERIVRKDVQSLLQRVHIREKRDYSVRFPNEMPTAITITTKDAKSYSIEKNEYAGFFTKPMTWEQSCEKFERLTSTNKAWREKLYRTIQTLENLNIDALTALLANLE